MFPVIFSRASSFDLVRPAGLVDDEDNGGGNSGNRVNDSGLEVLYPKKSILDENAKK